MISQAMTASACFHFQGKEATYLIYRKKLFGHFFINNQGMIGAIAPARKKYKSATNQSASIQISE